VESVVLLCLIPIAVFFEFAVEYVEEMFLSAIDHTAHHHANNLGESLDVATEDDVDAVTMHMHASKLYKELFSRAKGELMVLGFLAFLVWAVTQGEFWQELVPPKQSFSHFPRDWHTLHALVDNVHMHLFIAMCLHFIVVFATIWTGSFMIHLFTNTEVFHAAWFAEARGAMVKSGTLKKDDEQDDEEWAQYLDDSPEGGWEGFPRMRDRFNAQGLEIEERRIPLEWTGMSPIWYRDAYSKLTFRMLAMWAYREDSVDSYNLMRSYFIHHCGDYQHMEHMEDKCYPADFSIYAKLAVENMLHEISTSPHGPGWYAQSFTPFWLQLQRSFAIPALTGTL
jgi:hypothetical protein